ncbi:uncharacterized protein E0L32_002573 [Thyridium curvatum]|uniref:Uncharacterized protein n=1 Tax=Thyridium curvatum TaxID=1093900 RepID=A0A507BH77_9PEZI|nr:uncharacterized protein E0L32_002573 [Thyridium curvatum]TPX18716.1 hypothetical protein E0L32_002573 [Thyridium curvatum]
MKSILALTPVFLSAVSAAAIEKRQVTQFDVTNFVAGCTTAGTCSWSFEFAETPGGPSFSCAGTAPAAQPGNIFPTTSGTHACSDPAVNFFFQHIAPLSSYRIVVNDVRTVPGIGGSHAFAASEFSSASGAEQYVGTGSFTIVLPNP